jgi:phosphopantothenoylcysteine decarboxylase/phosphopantothenate--cysteine ligase
MNHVMWSNPAVQANRRTLEERGLRVLGPDEGSQACGETGAGRMLEPEAIAAIVCGGAGEPGTCERLLEGRTVLVTAGPTREPIDPVRYISNRSSGKMGYAMARAAAEQGARVILVSGPVAITAPKGVVVHEVQTAQEMYRVTHELAGEADIFIAAAAVADYRPAEVRAQKMKKAAESMTLELVRNPDILASIAALPVAPFTVGFAAETENVNEYAKGKLANKKLDMIVANQVGNDRGFDRDDNAVEVFWPGDGRAFPRSAKADLARDLLRLIAERFAASRHEDTRPELTIISSRSVES